MDTPLASFDWIAWIATIPGIPADWGARYAPPAPPAPVALRQTPPPQASHAELPRAA